MNHTNCKICRFEMIVSAVDRPFSMNVFYCKDHGVPFNAAFNFFLDGKVPVHCEHACDQPKRYRFYPEVPKGIERFSMTISCCPNPICQLPAVIQYIIYEGGVDSYPKCKDVLDNDNPAVVRPAKSPILSDTISLVG